MGDGDEAGVAIGEAGGFWKAAFGEVGADFVVELFETLEFAVVGFANEDALEAVGDLGGEVIS